MAFRGSRLVAIVAATAFVSRGAMAETPRAASPPAPSLAVATVEIGVAPTRSSFARRLRSEALPAVSSYEVVPYGHRLVERRHTGLMIAGGCLLGAGGLFLLVGLAASTATCSPAGMGCGPDREVGRGWMVFGGIAAGTGLLLLLVGSSKRKVLVPTQGSLVAPVVTSHGGGLSYVSAF